MFYILTFRRAGSLPTIKETFVLDEIRELIDALVSNRVDFTLVAFKR